jgi:type I restriction enzyme R subunit
MNNFTESEIEIFSLDELKDLGFSYTPGPSIAPDAEAFQGFRVGEPASQYGGPGKRATYGDVVLKHTLEQAIHRLNPAVPETARQEALKATLSVFSPQLIDANEAFQKMLAEGVPVTVRKDGQERGERVWLVDFQNPGNNDFYAINQFTVMERNQNKRPDVLLFVNGLPLVVIELKNPADKHATVRKAYDQIQTYKMVIPSLFFYNAFCVISDGLEAKAGTISSAFSRFQAWKTIDGKKESSAHVSQLEVLIKGMLNKATLLDLIRNFIVFEKDKKIDAKTGLVQIETVKKIAAYHQYHAVNKAVESTRLAATEKGNRKAGVIWHTQGSGKSLSMVFYTGKLIHNLDNPTVVVITDRNDLDQQLFDIQYLWRRRPLCPLG